VSLASVAQAVRAATTTAATSQATGALARCPVAAVHVFGAAAGVAYRPDQAEVARRAAVSLGSITQRDVLEVLMGLPVGMPVPVHALSERDRRVLRRAPHGAVDSDAADLVRRVVAPVSAQFAVVAARTWREGLVTAGRFAPLCMRAMLLPAPPEDADHAAMQASFYGIGICVFTAGTLRMLVEPQPYVRQRHTSAQWWFAEEVYRQTACLGSAGP
jgi:hypothetical protein